jgi:tetratricopeptide (TPR) repeat protein
VSALFTLSCHDLPEAARRMYRLLGVLPYRDFTVGLAAVAAGVDRNVAEDLLDCLVGASLLAESIDGRFSFHGLVRRHATEEAEAAGSRGEHVAALHRTVRYFLIRTVYADLAIMDLDRLRITPHAEIVGEARDPFSGPHRKNRALEWLDIERSNVLAAVYAAAEHEWHDMCWQLAESVTALYVVRRYVVDWTDSASVGANSAHLAGNTAAEARLRSFSSRAWTDLGDEDRAWAELTKALPLARRSGDTRVIASVCEMFARYYDHVKPAAADPAYNTAIVLFAEAEDERGVAFTTYFHGHSLAGRGQWTQALEVLERALGLVGRFDDDRIKGRVLTSRGITLGNLGRGTEAADTLAKAIDLLGPYPYFQAQAYEALGDLAVATGDRARGRAALNRAVEIHTKLGSPDIERLRSKLADVFED